MFGASPNLRTSRNDFKTLKLSVLLCKLYRLEHSTLTWAVLCRELCWQEPCVNNVCHMELGGGFFFSKKKGGVHCKFSHLGVALFEHGSAPVHCCSALNQLGAVWKNNALRVSCH